MADDCIFCKIIAGEIPSNVVYEDESVFAFEDLNPQAPVHTLVVPKEHYANLSDGVPAEVLGKVFASIDKIAEIKGVKESGYRIVANTGADAQQTVFHLHIHLLGGCKMPVTMGRAD